ncbi:heterokaryon incompatibility protein-domain-containing protein [Nemania abortiva]|nr:heterokaryon incompatibility protein-domain-containing protein [Nemania abortiva]
MASAHQSTYEHQPLTSPKSIRVVILEPAVSLEAPVKCTLDEVDLDNLTPSSSYEALSYVWGERFGTIPISCHERELLVTPNCYDALIHLRLPSKRLRLFVDAICIDQRQDLQQSMKERDHQIAIMGEVYARARRVMIWFGKSHPSTPKLINLMRFLHWAARVERASKKITGGTGIKLKSIAAKAYTKWLKGFRKDNLAGLQEAFDHFIQHPWFTRIWTLQEEIFASPKNLVMVHGSQQIKYVAMLPTLNTSNEWISFEESRDKETESVWKIERRYIFCDVMAGMIRSKIFADAERFRSELVALEEFRSEIASIEYLRSETASTNFLSMILALDSTDPRDKIFGIYSIFAQVGLDLPQPNSSTSAAEVFEATSREIVKKAASLGILMFCYGEASVIKGLPSWVPDWSMKPPSLLDPVSMSPNEFLNHGGYKASRNTEVRIKEAAGLGKLIVQGTVFAKIRFYAVSSTIGTYSEHTNSDRNSGLGLDFRDFIQACQRWAQNFDISSVNQSGSLSIDAVRRIMLLPEAETERHSMRSEERRKPELFSECFDIMMYPNCKIYDSAEIKAKFFDPVIQIGTHGGIIDTDFDIEKVLALVLARWNSGYNGMQTMLPPTDLDWLNLPNLPIYDNIMQWANYALMVLDTGHFARGFHTCKEGDIVALLAGCEFPVALRPDGDGNYRFVAPLYVDGIMHGEAWPEDESKLEDITLV